MKSIQYEDTKRIRKRRTLMAGIKLNYQCWLWWTWMETDRLIVVYWRGRSCRTLNITKHILCETPVYMDFVYVCVYNTVSIHYKIVGFYRYHYHGHERKQVHVVRADIHHWPIPHVPVGLGTKLTSMKPQCISELDTWYYNYRIIQWVSHKKKWITHNFYLFLVLPLEFHPNCIKNDRSWSNMMNKFYKFIPGYTPNPF